MAAPTRRLELRVTPGARREEVTITGDTIHIRVTAPPADGAANDAVLKLLAAALALPPRDLTLLRGASARIKLVAVTPR